MDRSVNDNFKFNKETEFVPILGLIASQLNSPPNTDNSESVNVITSSIQENHHPLLLSLLANELSVASEDIHDFEL